MPLSKYIKLHYSTDEFPWGNRAEFARVNGVHRQQVSIWIRKGYVVFDNRLYSPRRELIES